MTRRGFFAALATLPLVKKLLPKPEPQIAIDIECQPYRPSWAGFDRGSQESIGIRVVHNSKYDVECLNYMAQSQTAEAEMEHLTASLRKAGFEPMGDGPLADCWTPSQRYQPGDIVRLLDELQRDV